MEKNNLKNQDFITLTKTSLPEFLKHKTKVYIDSSALRSKDVKKLFDGSLSIYKNSPLYLNFGELNQDYSADTINFINELMQKNILKISPERNYNDLITSLSHQQGKTNIGIIIEDNNKIDQLRNSAKKCGNINLEFASVTSQPSPQKLRRESYPKRTSIEETPKTRKNAFLLKTQPEIINISPIILTKRIKKGDTVFDSSNNPIEIGSKKAVSNNSITYSTNTPGIWAKIYNQESLNTFYEEKLKRMLSKKVSYPGLCWPLDILRDEDGNFIGYLVNESKGRPLHLSIFKQGQFQEYFPDWDKKDLTELALNILKKIQYLHSMNILFGCINPASIYINDKNDVYFMDTDEYQIEGFPTLTYNNTFTPPEFLDEDLYLVSKENENYAIILLLFMIMMSGKIPYTSTNNLKGKALIKEGTFPFSYGDKRGEGIETVPSSSRFMWSHLTPFKELFCDTFNKKGSYAEPNKRKNTNFLIQKTKNFYNELQNPIDPESLNVFPKTFKKLNKDEQYFKCNYCGVEHPRFYFNDRYFDRFQICYNCLEKRSDVSFTCQACGKTYYYNNETALYHELKKQTDKNWRDQKYCPDCKEKKIVCPSCHEMKPYYSITDGKCWDCHSKEVYKTKTCPACNKPFNVTEGQHYHQAKNGLKEPICCPDCRRKTRLTKKCRSCGQTFSITNEQYYFNKKRKKNQPSLCKRCFVSRYK